MGVLDLQPGDVFEGYTVRRHLGRGGMGAVYLVHHPRFNADMALKVMTIQAATDAELETHRARFTREARTLVRLRHQNIIRVHDFAEHIDEDGVCPFILMEYFAGADGLKWIKQNPSLDRIRHVAVQLADALTCAHEVGVLHRDLKYGNILVNKNDEAVLIDFGIAKGEADETVTQTGMSVGTLSHMAPEILDGRPPEYTVKTDLWSFGCLLFFLTTHRNAFQSGGKGAAVLLRMIREEAHPSVRSLRSDASTEWTDLIDSLLKKDPAERVQTARELQRRLQAITQTTDPTAPAFVPPMPPGAQRTPTPGSPPGSSAASVAPASVSQPMTAHARMRVITTDDPFHAAKAEPQTVSKPALNLPPLDGITGIGTAQAPAPLPRDNPAPVALTREPSGVRATEPPADGLGTFIASIQPETAAPPAPAVAASVAPLTEHSTPRTGAFTLPAAPSESLSVVQPLPSFAPPTPKATTKQSALRALVLPIGAVAVIAVVGLGAFSMLGRQTPVAKPTPTQIADDEALKKAEERSNRELAALERAQTSSNAVPVAVPMPQPVAMPPAPAASPGPTATARTRLAGASEPAPAPAPESSAPVDPIAAKYGNRNFNTGSFGTAKTADAAAAAPAAGAVAGVKIPVRVESEIASTPSPVIATVTKETRVGSVTLPVGTQIHGTSSLGQGTRVTVQFRFAIVGGRNIPLAGQALAPDGRAGLPGTRTMGNGSDVAARALSSAVTATADAAAAVAGDNPLGAAVRGGGGTAAGKSERLNSDENIVMVKRGARFMVYVGG